MSEKPIPISKQQIAYEFIKSGIQGGTFAPRQRLVIDSLARDLSISKVPVREAVRRLEAEGLVVFSANSGAVVSGADVSLWFHLMEMLALLEGYATSLGAPFITKSDIRQLRAINRSMGDALIAYDFNAWTEGNDRFHQTINARCDNTALIEQIANLHDRTVAISRFVFPHSAVILQTLGSGGGKSALEAHEWLVAAFERKEKPSVIERHSRDHILMLANRTRDALKSNDQLRGLAKVA